MDDPPGAFAGGPPSIPGALKHGFRAYAEDNPVFKYFAFMSLPDLIFYSSPCLVGYCEHLRTASNPC